jgi:outer membrane protein
MIKRYGSWIAAVLFLFITVSVAGSETDQPILDILEGQEWKHRDTKGEIHLGKVATLLYPAYTVTANDRYRLLLEQLSEALKTPARKEYRVVLKGFTDSLGSLVVNQRASLKRAQDLKKLMTQDPSMALDAGRIQVEGLGEADPVASNQTAGGRDQNRRVEIHIYGNLGAAVRTVDTAPPVPVPVAVQKEKPVTAGVSSEGPPLPLSTSGVESLQEPETVRLSLFDAIRHGLENNQEIRVVAFTPQQAQEGLADAESVFDPEFFTEGTYRRDPNLQSSVTRVVMEDDSLVQSGIRKPLNTGGSVSGALALSYGDLLNAEFDRTYRYTFAPTFEIRQPLLKNIGGREEKAAIKIANYQMGISKEEFRRKVIDIATRISKSYWQLYLLRDYVVIDRQNFEMAEEVYRRETVRVMEGLSQQLDVERARSRTESRRGNLINSKERIRVSMDRLKLLINWSNVNIDSHVKISPADEPNTAPLDVNEKEVVEKAFQHRPELLQAKQRLSIRKVEEDLTQHLKLPTLDVFGRYAVSGYGREFSNAVDDTAFNDEDSWAAGLNFEYPIGNRSVEAKARRKKLERRQSEEQVARLRNQIKQEIKEVLSAIGYAKGKINSTQIARESAQNVVEGEFARFEIGQTTNVELLRAQDLLAATSRSYIRAIVDYNIALAELKSVQGELPRGLSIEELEGQAGN